MPSFSEVVKDHQQLKETIAAIEETKKKIRKNELDMHPPEEFALRKNESVVVNSSANTSVQSIIDNIIETGITGEIVLMKILEDGVKNKSFPPFSALQLWSYIETNITTTSTAIDASKKQIRLFLEKLQTKSSFNDNEIKTLSAMVNVINKDISKLTPNSVNATDIEGAVRTVIPEIATALGRTLPAFPSAGDIGSAVQTAMSSFSTSTGAAPTAPSSPGAATGFVPSLPATPTLPTRPTSPGTPFLTPTGAAAGTPGAAAGTPTGAAAGTPGTVMSSATTVPGESSPSSSATPIQILKNMKQIDAEVLITGTGITSVLQNNTLKRHGETLKKLQYLNTRSFKEAEWIGARKDVVVAWLLSIYLLGIALNKTNNWVPTILESNPTNTTILADKVKLIFAAQKSKYPKLVNPAPKFLKDILENKDVNRRLINEIFPASGNGFKSGSGLKNMGQLISRTEDLISAAQIGNKSKEVFNELDSNLSALIDKKKITKKYRDNLMKKLFF